MGTSRHEQAGVRHAHATFDRRQFLKGLSVAAVSSITGVAVDSTFTGHETVDFTLPSFDGTTLAGTVYPPTTSRHHQRGVLIPHCWAMSDDDARRRAASFAANGHVAVKYDSRGYGESGGSANVSDHAEIRDVRTVVEWAKDEGYLSSGPRLVIF